MIMDIRPIVPSMELNEMLRSNLGMSMVEFSRYGNDAMYLLMYHLRTKEGIDLEKANIFERATGIDANSWIHLSEDYSKRLSELSV